MDSNLFIMFVIMFAILDYKLMYVTKHMITEGVSK